MIKEKQIHNKYQQIQLVRK